MPLTTLLSRISLPPLGVVQTSQAPLGLHTCLWAYSWCVTRRSLSASLLPVSVDKSSADGIAEQRLRFREAVQYWRAALLQTPNNEEANITPNNNGTADICLIFERATPGARYDMLWSDIQRVHANNDSWGRSLIARLLDRPVYGKVLDVLLPVIVLCAEEDLLGTILNSMIRSKTAASHFINLANVSPIVLRAIMHFLMNIIYAESGSSSHAIQPSVLYLRTHSVVISIARSSRLATTAILNYFSNDISLEREEIVRKATSGLFVLILKLPPAAARAAAVITDISDALYEAVFPQNNKSDVSRSNDSCVFCGLSVPDRRGLPMITPLPHWLLSTLSAADYGLFMESIVASMQKVVNDIMSRSIANASVDGDISSTIQGGGVSAMTHMEDNSSSFLALDRGCTVLAAMLISCRCSSNTNNCSKSGGGCVTIPAKDVRRLACTVAGFLDSSSDSKNTVTTTTTTSTAATSLLILRRQISLLVFVGIALEGGGREGGGRELDGEAMTVMGLLASNIERHYHICNISRSSANDITTDCLRDELSYSFFVRTSLTLLDGTALCRASLACVWPPAHSVTFTCTNGDSSGGRNCVSGGVGDGGGIDVHHSHYCHAYELRPEISEARARDFRHHISTSRNSSSRYGPRQAVPTPTSPLPLPPRVFSPAACRAVLSRLTHFPAATATTAASMRIHKHDIMREFHKVVSPVATGVVGDSMWCMELLLTNAAIIYCSSHTSSSSSSNTPDRAAEIDQDGTHINSTADSTLDSVFSHSALLAIINISNNSSSSNTNRSDNDGVPPIPSPPHPRSHRVIRAWLSFCLRSGINYNNSGSSDSSSHPPLPLPVPLLRVELIALVNRVTNNNSSTNVSGSSSVAYAELERCVLAFATNNEPPLPLLSKVEGSEGNNTNSSSSPSASSSSDVGVDREVLLAGRHAARMVDVLLAMAIAGRKNNATTANTRTATATADVWRMVLGLYTALSQACGCRYNEPTNTTTSTPVQTTVPVMSEHPFEIFEWAQVPIRLVIEFLANGIIGSSTSPPYFPSTFTRLLATDLLRGILSMALRVCPYILLLKCSAVSTGKGNNTGYSNNSCSSTSCSSSCSSSSESNIETSSITSNDGERDKERERGRHRLIRLAFTYAGESTGGDITGGTGGTAPVDIGIGIDIGLEVMTPCEMSSLGVMCCRNAILDQRQQQVILRQRHALEGASVASVEAAPAAGGVGSLPPMPLKQHRRHRGSGADTGGGGNNNSNHRRSRSTWSDHCSSMASGTAVAAVAADSTALPVPVSGADWSRLWTLLYNMHPAPQSLQLDSLNCILEIDQYSASSSQSGHHYIQYTNAHHYQLKRCGGGVANKYPSSTPSPLPHELSIEEMLLYARVAIPRLNSLSLGRYAKDPVSALRLMSASVLSDCLFARVLLFRFVLEQTVASRVLARRAVRALTSTHEHRTPDGTYHYHIAKPLASASSNPTVADTATALPPAATKSTDSIRYSSSPAERAARMHTTFIDVQEITIGRVMLEIAAGSSSCVGGGVASIEGYMGAYVNDPSIALIHKLFEMNPPLLTLYLFYFDAFPSDRQIAVLMRGNPDLLFRFGSQMAFFLTQLVHGYESAAAAGTAREHGGNGPADQGGGGYGSHDSDIDGIPCRLLDHIAEIKQLTLGSITWSVTLLNLLYVYFTEVRVEIQREYQAKHAGQGVDLDTKKFTRQCDIISSMFGAFLFKCIMSFSSAHDPELFLFALARAFGALIAARPAMATHPFLVTSELYSVRFIGTDVKSFNGYQRAVINNVNKGFPFFLSDVMYLSKTETSYEIYQTVKRLLSDLLIALQHTLHNGISGVFTDITVAALLQARDDIVQEALAVSLKRKRVVGEEELMLERRRRSQNGRERSRSIDSTSSSVSGGGGNSGDGNNSDGGGVMATSDMEYSSDDSSGSSDSGGDSNDDSQGSASSSEEGEDEGSGGILLDDKMTPSVQN